MTSKRTVVIIIVTLINYTIETFTNLMSSVRLYHHQYLIEQHKLRGLATLKTDYCLLTQILRAHRAKAEGWDSSVGIATSYELDGPGIERQFQWPSGQRRGFAADRLMGLRVRIPPGAWMFVL